MSRRKLSLLLVPVAIVLFGAATITAGNAEDSSAPPWPGKWICAQGTLALAAVDPGFVALTGSVRPCPGVYTSIVGARWGMARYHAAGARVYERAIRPYASATNPTVFEVRVLRLWQLEQSLGPLQATCLITMPFDRKACFAITVESDGALRAEPIPVNDPRVSATVSVITGDGPDPECGACV
jgi:hypothetical protein